MGIVTTGKHCNNCDKGVMAQKNAPNHVLHFFFECIYFRSLGYHMDIRSLSTQRADIDVHNVVKMFES